MSRGSKMLALAMERAAALSANNKRGQDQDVCDKSYEIHYNSNHPSLEEIDLQFDGPSGSGITETKNLIHLKDMQEESTNFESSDDSIKDPDYLLSSSETESIVHWGRVIEDSLDKMCPNSVFMSNHSKRYVERQEDENMTSSSTNIKYTTQYRQELRNKGLPYKTLKRNKIVPARKIKLLSSCRNMCKDKITVQHQQQLFENYWALGCYTKRILYISSLINVRSKTSTKVKKSGVKNKDRQLTVEYSIEVNCDHIKVCKSCFLGCFGESNAFIRSVINKKLNSPSNTLVDKRGKSKPLNALSIEEKNEIKTHIMKFPAYESHYTRRDTCKKYLQFGLTISKMYNLYCSENENPKSLSSYTKIFHEMNLKIKSPQLDTCGTCDKLHHKISAVCSSDEKLKLTTELEYHQNKADFAYACKKKDKSHAIMNKNFAVYAFDLQQCLPTPFLKSNIAFYKRQLWTYNLTVHNLVTNQPYCYMWHEGMAKRGGNEMACCIFKHIDEEVSVSVKNLIFYSDSCAGQNKNTHVSCMFIAALASSEQLEIVDHKFLEPGHTHMECDVDHSVIERKKKSTAAKIHHPRDWLNFIAAIRDKNPFKVKEMQKSDFLDFATTSKEKFTWRKVNTDGEKYSWREFRWLRYFKNDFGSLFYKNSLDEEEPFKKINLKKRGANSLKKADIKFIQNAPSISKEKAQDLLFLLDFIDPQFHSFYRSLVVDAITNQNVHPDVSDSDDDDE